MCVWSHVWLFDPVNCSQPGSSVHRISQTGILEWVSMPSSRGSSQPRDRTPHLLSPAFAGGLFAASATSNPNNISIHISINFQIIFPDRLLQSIGYSSLYSMVSPCWLSILYIFTGYFLITHPHHLWEKGNNTVIQCHDFLKSVLKQYKSFPAIPYIIFC